jgi:hypothetical protein
MSYWIAGAAVGSAVIGGASANNAANKSASAARSGIASTERLMNQARNDSINLFTRAIQSSQSGIDGALKFYQENAAARINPFVQGNMAAQRVIGQGATQANNAILGLPVDMAFANNPQALAADYSGITSASLPQLGTQLGEPAGPQTPEDIKNRIADPTGLKALLGPSTVAEENAAARNYDGIQAIGGKLRSMALGRI